MKRLVVVALILIVGGLGRAGLVEAGDKHSLIVYTAFFELRSAELEETATKTLMEMAELMSGDPAYEVKIAAYTDPEKEDKDDEELAEERADAVREVLLVNGVDHDRIDTEIEGDHDGFGKDDSRADRALRRRVEVRIRQVTDHKRRRAKALDKDADTHLQTTVFFGFDKSEVRREFEPMLKRIGEMLDKNDDFRVGLFGHTDGIGSKAYNEELGRRRCQAVQEVLIAAGAPSKSVHIESLGEDETIGAQEPEATTSRALSRSVEIKIVEIDD